LYRASKYDECIQRMKQAMEAYAKESAAAASESLDVAADYLFLAMAHQHLGHDGEAQDWLTKAENRAKTPSRQRNLYGGDDRRRSWQDRLRFQLLLREARTLLAPDP
jgi:hypothetical protein